MVGNEITEKNGCISLKNPNDSFLLYQSKKIAVIVRFIE